MASRTRHEGLRIIVANPFAPVKGQRRKQYDNLRKFLAYISVALLVFIVGHVFGDFLDSRPAEALPAMHFNDPTKEAIAIRIDQARNMFQLGLAITVALWGLLVARKEEAILVLSDKPEILMSISAACLLASSFICHLFYLNRITYLYRSAGGNAARKFEYNDTLSSGWVLKDTLITQVDIKGSELIYIPDIFDNGVNYLFTAQRDFLIAGIIIAALTFISAHKLK